MCNYFLQYNRILFTVLHLLMIGTACTQNPVQPKKKKTVNTFFTETNYRDSYTKRKNDIIEICSNIEKGGHKPKAPVQIGFSFIAAKKEKLQQLAAFIKKAYPDYMVEEITKDDARWLLDILTNEIPFIKESIIAHTMELYKKGYEYDVKLDGVSSMYQTSNNGQ